MAGVYVPVLSAGYVWDDGGLVTANETLAHPTWDAVFGRDLWAGVAGLRSPYYRPGMTISLLADRALGGAAPVAHAQSLLWHLVAVGLLAGLARASKAGRGWLVAVGLWALHPLNSEAVTWVAARNDLLAAVAIFAALLAAGSPVLLFVAALLGLLCKESAILLLPLYALWRWGQRLPLLRGDLLALAAATTAWATLRSRVELGDLPTIDPSSAWTPASAGAALIRTLGWATLPWPLTSTAGSGTPLPATSWVGAALTLLGIGWLLKDGDRRRVSLVAMAALPALLAGLGAAGYGLLGERYLYLPLAFLALALPPMPRPPLALPLLVASVVALQIRLPDWHDELSLYGAAARRAPDSYTLHLLAGAQLRAGDVPGAGQSWDLALSQPAPVRVACRPAVELGRAVLPTDALLAHLPLWTEAGCRSVDGVDGLVATELLARGREGDARAWTEGSVEPDPAGRIDVARMVLAGRDGDLLGAGAIDLATGGALRDRTASLALAIPSAD